MKQEQATNWLYFCMLYCTGAYLASIGWHCSTKPIKNVAMPISKFRR